MASITKRALLAAAPALCLASACRSQGMAAANLGQRIPKEFFGMHIQYNAEPPLYSKVKLQPYVDLGQGSVRIWGSDGGWKTIQKEGPGSFDWARLDSIIASLQAAGVKEIIYTIGGATPAWASGGQDTFPKATNYNGFPPLKDDDWVTFIKALVNRYKGRIAVYEIWNEWDLMGTWRGNPEQMAGFARSAYRTIKDIDRSVKVVAPTLSSTGSRFDAFRDFLRMGGGESCDILGMHGYYGSGAPENIKTFLERFRAMAAAAGVDKPVWDTEVGISNWLDDDHKVRNLKMNGDSMPADRAMAHVPRVMMANWLGGALRAEFFGLDVGKVEAVALTGWPDNPTAVNPAGRAYQHLAQLLTGGMLSNYSETGGSCQADFVSAAQGRGTAYWRKYFDTAPQRLTAARGAVDVLGQSVDVSSGELMLTAKPVFVFA